jgi:hypothetical protein
MAFSDHRVSFFTMKMLISKKGGVWCMLAQSSERMLTRRAGILSRVIALLGMHEGILSHSASFLKAAQEFLQLEASAV